jgi:hypothetical protein
MLNVIRAPDPFYLIATLLDRIDQGSDIACDIVQQVHFCHYRLLFLVSFVVYVS